MNKHSWVKKDDLIILYIYKFGFNKCPYTKHDLANEIGVSEGSVNYRIGNFKAIDGIGNATHFAKLSKQVHDSYSTLDEPELRGLAFS